MKSTDPIDLHSVVDTQYRQIIQQEKEINSLKSELAQEERLHRSARTSATIATTFFFFFLFVSSWAIADRNSYKEELEQLKEESSDTEYFYEETLSSASNDYSELLTQYDDLLSYAEMLEEDNARLERDLEDAMDILDELESYGYYY